MPGLCPLQATTPGCVGFVIESSKEGCPPYALTRAPRGGGTGGAGSAVPWIASRQSSVGVARSAMKD
ncbi:hypothetical protein GCM10025795_03240 [Verticiella sediminum]